EPQFERVAHEAHRPPPGERGLELATRNTLAAVAGKPPSDETEPRRLRTERRGSIARYAGGSRYRVHVLPPRPKTRWRSDGTRNRHDFPLDSRRNIMGLLASSEQRSRVSGGKPKRGCLYEQSERGSDCMRRGDGRVVLGWHRDRDGDRG